MAWRDLSVVGARALLEPRSLTLRVALGQELRRVGFLLCDAAKEVVDAARAELPAQRRRQFFAASSLSV
jgi:hypothetical protein